MRNFLTFVIALLAIFSGKAQSPLSERIANYTMQVRLEPTAKTLLGQQQIEWRNASDQPVSEIYIHLYLNGFRDRKSTFMKERLGMRAVTDTNSKSFEGGNIYLTKLQTADGDNLLSGLTYVQPDDGNPDDRSLAKINLKKPLAPGQTLILLTQFRAQLPRVTARTGFARNDFFLIAQWFPKIGVLEAKGVRGAPAARWAAQQFHGQAEFYADFGVYDVRITLPENFKVGATGKHQNIKKAEKGWQTWHFYANDVHDFAWTASPHYEIIERKWRHVTIKLLIQPEHRHFARRYLEAAETSLAYFDKLLGTYPYTTLTLVDPPVAASAAGGMEYPTFITLGTYWGMGQWAKFPEMVTVHEFGHQYFQGMLASNEVQEAWLDEGLNQYLETRLVDEHYGYAVNIFGYKIPDTQLSRHDYLRLQSPGIAATHTPVWQLPSRTHTSLIYSKTAVVMHTFENFVGRPAMDDVLKTYFDRWKFKHPATEDFIAVAKEVIAKRGIKFDVEKFFRQTILEGPTCDYAVTWLQNSGRKETPYGEIRLTRFGEMQLPTDVLVVFTDKSQKLIRWDDARRYLDFSFSKKIDQVIIDPERKNLLDSNRINNSRTIKMGTGVFTKYSASFLFWLQTIFQLLAGF